MDLISENKLQVKKLSNGLTVKLIEKPNFQVFNVQLIVNFGSSYSKSGVSRIPPGTAHLIEHLLFHKKNSEIDSLFLNLGIDINAYTTYNWTDFFYSILQQQNAEFEQALRLLFQLVFKPYFTSELVEKELKIINSEIQMAKDDPDSDLYSEFLAKLFPDTPLSYDILGTKENLAQINVNLLEQIHRNYYQPSNMVLYICGPISFKQLLRVVDSIQIPDTCDSQDDFTYYYVPVSDSKKLPSNTLTKLVYGWSLPDLNLSYRDSLIFSLFLENMLGQRSQFFHRMYNEGVLNDDFFYEFIVEKNFTVVFFSCLTYFPTKVIQETWETINHIEISDEKYKITVKNFVGKYIQSFDSIDELSTLETDGKFHIEDQVGALKIVEGLQVEQVKLIAKKILEHAQYAQAWRVIS